MFVHANARAQILIMQSNWSCPDAPAYTFVRPRPTNTMGVKCMPPASRTAPHGHFTFNQTAQHTCQESGPRTLRHAHPSPPDPLRLQSPL